MFIRRELEHIYDSAQRELFRSDQELPSDDTIIIGSDLFWFLIDYQFFATRSATFKWEPKSVFENWLIKNGYIDVALSTGKCITTKKAIAYLRDKHPVINKLTSVELLKYSSHPQYFTDFFGYEIVRNCCYAVNHHENSVAQCQYFGWLTQKLEITSRGMDFVKSYLDSDSFLQDIHIRFAAVPSYDALFLRHISRGRWNILLTTLSPEYAQRYAEQLRSKNVTTK